MNCVLVSSAVRFMCLVRMTYVSQVIYDMKKPDLRFIRFDPC